jgi:hypothetical protein
LGHRDSLNRKEHHLDVQVAARFTQADRFDCNSSQPLALPGSGNFSSRDNRNGIFAGTNNYIAEIGARQPMTVEEFVSRNREAFV